MSITGIQRATRNRFRAAELEALVRERRLVVEFPPPTGEVVPESVDQARTWLDAADRMWVRHERAVAADFLRRFKQ